MSRDIRSYFTQKKVQKPAVEDDDDVIPESPDVQIRNKKKGTRKKRFLSNDSDEEIFSTKKNKSTHESSKTSLTKNKNQTLDKPALKEVKVIDLFGSEPIKRTEPLVKKVKKKTETGIHSDDDFEKSLLEVDEIEESALKDVIKDKKSDSNHDESTNKVKDEDIKKEKHLKPNIQSTVTSQSQINGDHNSKESSDFVIKKQDEKNNEIGVSSSKKDKKTAFVEVRESKNEKKKDFSEFIECSTSKKVTHNIEKDSEKVKSNKSQNEKKKGFSETTECNSSKKQTHNSEKDCDKKKTNKSHDKSVLKIVENCKSIVKKDKKRDFTEFTECDQSFSEEHGEDTHKSKKKKLDQSLNESALTDEERHERKRHSAALYQQYLNRSGPKHLGAKEIPEGSPNCLKEFAFLLTGVLDSFERDEVVEAITKYGGCIKNSISKKVTHVLAGEEAGPAKMAKAQELGIRIINEDEFLQMIKGSSKKKSTNKLEIKKEAKNEKSPSRKSDKDKLPKEHRRHNSKEKHRDDKSCSKIKIDDDPRISLNSTKNKETQPKTPNKETHEIKIEDIESKPNEVKKEIPINGIKSESSSNVQTLNSNSIMWVEKYKPQSVKQIIGQHGDASNVKKLTSWLTKWYVNRKAKLPKPSPWAKNDDGGYYKAALLSGPPGVGKTTSVALVCNELGFDTVEFNASDTRNKTLIKEQIGELLTTTSLSAYAKGDTGKQAVTKKHVLIMDEVDGMAGNEDRGGMQELIALIKSTSVPIICMCNDRNSQKMRSLVNYCYDLRFNRPRVEQIKAAMMSICCKEGIKIPQEALTQLIVSANQDVRQTLNLLSMWAVDPDLTDSDRLKKDAKNARKDVKLGPWEAIRKVFTAEEHKNMTLNDRSDLFFYDYSLAPLFVQENYLQVVPHCPKHEVLERISRAADSISLGDLVEARIRRSQAWSLLPTQAMFSSVIPGHAMAGHVAGQIQFPGWLGKNSRGNKMQRLCQEIHAHTRLSTTGSKSSIFLDYCSHLRDAIVTPLLKDRSDGIAKSLQVLESYHLLRDDLDSLSELALWPGQRNPMILIDSKVKASMTRTYNKTAMALPYAPGGFKRGRARDADELDLELGEEPDDDDPGDERDSDPENDALIKKKKVKEEKPSTSKAKASTSKEKQSTSKDKPSTGKSKRK